MIRIAIVEDDKEQLQLLEDYLKRFSYEHDVNYNIFCFFDATSFLEKYDNSYDIIFMDIELPDGNGMEVIRKIRENDKKTLVIFVTDLAQFAVKGYEVRAFDFIVKPISYYNFELKFISALDNIEINKDIEFWLQINGGKVKLSASRITYVEIANHYIIYHTLDGNYSTFGSLKNVAEQLNGAPFSSCNQCYLVNLKYVTSVTNVHVTVRGENLLISRRKKTSFMKDLDDYLAGGK